jgi:hypothetical protein
MDARDAGAMLGGGQRCTDVRRDRNDKKQRLLLGCSSPGQPLRRGQMALLKAGTKEASMAH